MLAHSREAKQQKFHDQNINITIHDRHSPDNDNKNIHSLSSRGLPQASTHPHPQPHAYIHTSTSAFHVHMLITATRKIESDERANVVFSGAQEPAPCVDRRPCCCYYCNSTCTPASWAAFFHRGRRAWGCRLSLLLVAQPCRCNVRFLAVLSLH